MYDHHVNSHCIFYLAIPTTYMYIEFLFYVHLTVIRIAPQVVRQHCTGSKRTGLIYLKCEKRMVCLDTLFTVNVGFA